MIHDVVYILKNDYKGEEFLYSIRSVCLNFPYRKIVTVGGCPDNIYPDIKLEHQQVGTTKWERAKSSLIKAFSCEELSEDIWLFNDDFFVMDKVRPHEDVNYFNGTLERRIIEMKRKFPNGSNYIGRLELMRAKLLKMDKDTLSFALHLPMLINRKKALDLINANPSSSTMFRSFYGNYYEIPCEYMKDVKILDLVTVPDTPFISTSDESFKRGKVGEFLKLFFKEPCAYELSQEDRLRKEVKEYYDEEGNIRYDL